MTDEDFVLVREAFSESAIARTFAAGASLMTAASRSSVISQAITSRRERLSAMPKAASIATIAVAIAIAAAMQPLLIAVMPVTIKPALPWPAFLIVMVFAAVIAWRPEPFVEAWGESRLA